MPRQASGHHVDGLAGVLPVPVGAVPGHLGAGQLGPGLLDGKVDRVPCCDATSLAMAASGTRPGPRPVRWYRLRRGFGHPVQPFAVPLHAVGQAREFPVQPPAAVLRPPRRGGDVRQRARDGGQARVRAGGLVGAHLPGPGGAPASGPVGFAGAGGAGLGAFPGRRALAGRGSQGLRPAALRACGRRAAASRRGSRSPPPPGPPSPHRPRPQEPGPVAGMIRLRTRAVRFPALPVVLRYRTTAEITDRRQLRMQPLPLSLQLRKRGT